MVWRIDHVAQGVVDNLDRAAEARLALFNVSQRSWTNAEMDF
jgi:hypothetical protein